jgi:hypothetical protein
MRLGQILGNVTFIERPFHPTRWSASSASRSAARRRQYQTRAILADSDRKRRLAADGLNAGHLGALELHLPEFELEASDTCSAYFGAAGRTFLVSGSAAGSPDDRARRCRVSAAISSGSDYSIEYRVIWPDGLAALGRRTRPRDRRRPDGSISRWSACLLRYHRAQDGRIERENLLEQLAAERTALAGIDATLEQRVEQRTADLMKEVAAREKAQEQLRQAQKMETIGSLPAASRMISTIC